MSLSALSERVTSAANVSVGTSLAMETIIPSWPVFDPAREAPLAVPISQFQRVFFNLWTLARNLHNAIPLAYRDSVSGHDAGMVLAEEAMEVVSAVESTSAASVQGLIYYPSYAGLQREYKKGRLRTPTTDKQKASQALLQEMCDVAAKQLETNHKKHFKRFNVRLLPDGYGNTLLFTHFPVDLLSESRLGRCSLLESHTGVVKQKNLWYTKLFAGKTLSNIPFNAATLQIFGDDHQFRPWETKIKNALIQMAKDHRWSWATTNSKMRQDMSTHPDRIFAMALQDLL